MALLMTLTTIFTALSLVLLIALLYIYFKGLKKVKSGFTLGLFFFAALFFLQNAVSLYFYLTMMDLYVSHVAIHVFIFTILQVIAFSILLYNTWK